MFLGLDCCSDDDSHHEAFEWICWAVFLHLRFQNWARIVVRFRLFCKAKTVISIDTHTGRFRITQTAISPSHIGISQSREHAAIALHREAEEKLRGQGESILERLRYNSPLPLSLNLNLSAEEKTKIERKIQQNASTYHDA